MADSVYDIIKFAAILLAAAIVFLVGANIVTSVRSFGNKTARNMDADATAFEETRYTQYEGAEISGAEVVSILKKMEYDKICIAVKIPSGTHYYNYTNYNLSAKSTESIDDAKDSTNTSKYINPSWKFVGEVHYNGSTGTINGLFFEKV